jgi:endonuclease III
VRDRPLKLQEVVKTLSRRHGTPPPPPSSDPFELVLWENVAYLASPARRREAFELLRLTVGTTPEAILSARPAALERVTARGILKATFAAKLRQCAAIVRDDFGGDLRPVLDLPLGPAKRALRKFPGIGEPGAEKILLFAGRHPLLAPDSNGLRVLVRLGLIAEGKSYARTYAASQAMSLRPAPSAGFLQQAHLLLQQHGRTLCKQSAPRCEACPLAPRCAHAAAVTSSKAKPARLARARRTAAR